MREAAGYIKAGGGVLTRPCGIEGTRRRSPDTRPTGPAASTTGSSQWGSGGGAAHAHGAAREAQLYTTQHMARGQRHHLRAVEALQVGGLGRSALAKVVEREAALVGRLRRQGLRRARAGHFAVKIALGNCNNE